MTRALFILAFVFALTLQAADSTNSAPTVVTNAPAAVDPRSFDAFKILAERNIFDPNRGPARSRDRDREERRPVRIDTLTLVGAMSYTKGAFAFFDGSQSEYRKSVKAGDTIAGYNVAAVTTTNVVLQAGDKKVDLAVGSHLRRRDEGEWEVSSQVEPAPTSTNSGSASSETKSEPASTEGMSDALKRLMEKRQREK